MSLQVLIVEDEVALCFIYERVCQRLNCESVVANDGMSALEILDTVTPDLIILDMLLPGISGLEVFEWITQQGDRFPHTAIAIISSDSKFGVITQQRSNTKFMQKPILPNQIEALIEELIAVRN